MTYPPAYGPPMAPPQRKRHPVLLGCGIAAGVGLLLIVGLIVVAAVAVNHSSGTGSTSASSTTAHLNQPAKDGKFTFVVTSLTTTRHVGDSVAGKTAQGEFILAHVTVTNHGDQAQTLDASNQYLIVGNKQYSADDSALIYMNSDQALMNQLNPGVTTNAVIPFDVPKGLRPTAIILHDSAFSGGVRVSLS